MQDSNYHEVTKNKPPTKLLLEAVEYVKEKGDALDLGAGAFSDSKFLIEKGFNVFAVDISKESEILAQEIKNKSFSFKRSSIESFFFEEDKYLIINAAFSLPFIDSDDFTETFSSIKKSLKQDGVLCCQLFGVHDEWNQPGKAMTFHTRQEVDDLLSGMNVIKLIERDFEGPTAMGVQKHWHIFYIIAQRD
jgi:SAM-dependent methyltransferase